MPTAVDTGVRTRGLAEQSISAALEADWPRAIDLNKKILGAVPEDVEARNRLGRAHLEQGKLDDARAAFAEVLKLEPNNPIALRNQARITSLVEHKTKPHLTKTRTQSRLFIEDMGKTGILRLMNPAPPHILFKYSPGADAELRESEGLIAVHARDGEMLGFLEPKVGRRLLELLKSGNQYVVALVANDQVYPRVAIRETFQSSENAHRISFPGHHRPAETKERAYIKGTFFRLSDDDDSLDEPASESDVEETVADDASDEAGSADERLPVEDDGDEDDDTEE
ncbi:MAG: tetratricopeptide repeat protein [Chloroflexota bacterium]|nr:tetratricopeptide repeat protein [Chloroflexota bacterium]